MTNTEREPSSGDPGDELGKAGNEAIDEAGRFGTDLIDTATNSSEENSDNESKKDAA